MPESGMDGLNVALARPSRLVFNAKFPLFAVPLSLVLSQALLLVVLENFTPDVFELSISIVTLSGTSSKETLSNATFPTPERIPIFTIMSIGCVTSKDFVK
ncbi:hypothetical protein D3C84_1051850 [compost metagenome]